MAALLIEIIKEYGFEDRLGYFIADNVESNDVCIDLIFQTLKSALLPA